MQEEKGNYYNPWNKGTSPTGPGAGGVGSRLSGRASGNAGQMEDAIALDKFHEVEEKLLKATNSKVHHLSHLLMRINAREHIAPM